MKTLIVDDNQENLYLLDYLLKTNGYEVVSAENGKEALEKIHAEKFDLIISDILMPVMDGLEFCKQVKGDTLSRSIPFIFLTAAYIDDKDAEVGLKLGADLFIRKPIDPQTLLKEINNVILTTKTRTQPELATSSEAADFVMYNHVLIRKLVLKLENNLSELREEIRERQASEELLKRSELRFMNFFENIPEYCYMISADGKITDINKAALSALGYHKDELIGKPFQIIYPSESQEKVRQLFSKWLEKGVLQDEDIEIQSRDGQRRTVLLNANLINDGDGKLLNLICVQKDITDMKKLQEKLLSAERLAMLGTVSGGISHELKNALGAIGTSNYYLKTRLKDADNSIRVHFDRIQANVDKGSNTIESLLNLTRMKEPQLGQVNVASIVNESINTANIAVPVNLVRNFPLQDISVVADRNQLRIVFDNIIRNALEAMENKGTLTIGVRQIPEDMVEISVTDTGCGIPPDGMNKIFRPFFTTKARGFGFGLFLARMIIEKHHGTMEVKSGQGKGTTFAVHLPLFKKNGG